MNILNLSLDLSCSEILCAMAKLMIAALLPAFCRASSCVAADDPCQPSAYNRCQQASSSTPAALVVGDFDDAVCSVGSAPWREGTFTGCSDSHGDHEGTESDGADFHPESPRLDFHVGIRASNLRHPPTLDCIPAYAPPGRAVVTRLIPIAAAHVTPRLITLAIAAR